MCVQIAEWCAEPPNDVDTETSLSKFKNGKANGHDQIPAQLIKEGEELKDVIYKLISKIQEEKITLYKWKYGIIICPIHQKGDVYTSSVNGISLLTAQSDCSQMRSKVSSDWLPNYITVMRLVLKIFKMDGYFPDSPLTLISLCHSSGEQSLTSHHEDL